MRSSSKEKANTSQNYKLGQPCPRKESQCIMSLYWPSGQAVDKEVYISKCLVKLKKLIKEVYKNDKIVFWPDLASAHYSNKVQYYLKGEKSTKIAYIGMGRVLSQELTVFAEMD